MSHSNHLTGAALAGAALLLLTSGVAAAQAPSVQRWVYSTGGDLWVTDGVTPATPLTDLPGRAESPDWSADGSAVVFVRKAGSGRRETSKLWVVGADGLGLRQLTRGAGYDVAPRWSPDGRRVVFQRKAGRANSDVYVVNATGSGTRRLTRSAEGERDPVWSPDGRRIAFARSASARPDYDLWTMSATGGRQKRLLRSPRIQLEPDWSPDGRTIAFAQESGRVPKRPRKGVYYNLDVWTISVSSTPRLRRVTTAARDQYHPRWSPDGARISYNSEVSGSGCPGSASCNMDVLVATPGVATPVPLVAQPGAIEWGADWGPLGPQAVPAAPAG
jgi:Tol biopolymer transport system component